MAARHLIDVEFPKMKIGSVWLDVDWRELLIPKGEAPFPPDHTVAWSPSIAQQRKGRLSELLKPAGRYNPRVRISKVIDPDQTEVVEADAYDFIDRPWTAAELPQMVRKAEKILSRAGFDADYEQHYLVERQGSWFVYAHPGKLVEGYASDERYGDACPGMPIDRDAVEDRYDELLFVDLTRFEYLPESIADAAAGPYGRLAWAMEVLRRSRGPARFERRAELAVSPVGRIGEAFRSGHVEDAAAHVAWMLDEAWRAGWADGSYFECVRVSDAIARNHREDSAKQTASKRSLDKQRREAAMTIFIASQDPHAALTDLELARRAHTAFDNADPIFEGLDDLMDAENSMAPKETAKEIGRLRKAAKKMAEQRALSADVAAKVTALLKAD